MYGYSYAGIWAKLYEMAHTCTGSPYAYGLPMHVQAKYLYRMEQLNNYIYSEVV